MVSSFNCIGTGLPLHLEFLMPLMKNCGISFRMLRGVTGENVASRKAAGGFPGTNNLKSNSLSGGLAE